MRHKTKRIRCKVPGCDRRRVVAASSGAKFCREHAVQRRILRGRTHIQKCRYPGCKAPFVPLFPGDQACAKHTPVLSTEHPEGECAKCHRKARLYEGSPWCLACCKRVPA